MKKKNPQPPEDWPSQAKALFSEYAGQLMQRTRSAHGTLQLLEWFLCYQESLGLSFREFSAVMLGDYLEKHGPYYQGHVATVLRGWLRFLYQRKQLLLPLHEELRLKRTKPRKRALLSHEEVLQVLELPPLDEPQGLRDRAFLEMAYGTGMRRSELTALTLGDVDLTLRRVHVELAKNTHPRNLPLTSWACHFLSRYLHEARPQLATPLSPNALWLNRFGRRLGRNCVGARLNKIYGVREKLGFGVTLHQLRHACATHLLRGGASLRDIQELLGHLELESTRTYTHITPLHLCQMHDRCHPRNLESFPLKQG